MANAKIISKFYNKRDDLELERIEGSNYAPLPISGKVQFDSADKLVDPQGNPLIGSLVTLTTGSKVVEASETTDLQSVTFNLNTSEVDQNNAEKVFKKYGNKRIQVVAFSYSIPGPGGNVFPMLVQVDGNELGRFSVTMRCIVGLYVSTFKSITFSDIQVLA